MLLRMSLAALLAAITIGLALAQGPSAPKPAQPAPNTNAPQAGQNLAPPASANSHAVRVGPDAIDGNKPVIVKRNNN